ncbi:MAG: glycosyltransferase family 4 protein [Planctomycetes bacterium]|nr:glycosyltransferase family 4 protein [Planctomycetota bacterium]
MPLGILQLNSARNFVGEAAHTLNLTEALRRDGHRVVLGLRANHDTFHVAYDRNLDPVGFRMPHRWWPPQDLPDLRRIAEVVRRENVQIIHAHRGKDHWQAVAAVKLYRLRIPVVRTRHVVTPLRAHVGNRWLAKRTARMIAVSKAVEDDVRASGLFSDGRLLRIPGGINLERYARKGKRAEARAALGLPESAPVAACVARFAAVKAHDVLIDAWRIVADALPDARLVLAGRGKKLRVAAEAQIERLKLQGNVTILGQVPDAQILELLEAADAGVLSSIGSEGFSRAVLEYMAMGLPVAATSVGAVPDLVEPGVSGVLAPPGEARALAEALRSVLAAPQEHREAWGKAGRARAEERHGYAQWAAAHAKLYGEVLAEYSKL